MRNLSGRGVAVVCGYCGRVHHRPPAPRPGSVPRSPPVPSTPIPSAPSTPGPPTSSTRVGPGVLLCWRAPSLPRVRYKILPARLFGGENGTKLSLHVEKAPNRAISGEQGEFCTGSGTARLVLGEICFVVAPSVCAVAGFPPPTGAPSWPSRPCSALDTGSGGGFAPCEALWRRVAGVSHPCMAQFPPFGSGAAMVCSGMAPTSQTTSAKNLEIGLLVAKWSAFWAQRCLAWCVGRT